MTSPKALFIISMPNNRPQGVYNALCIHILTPACKNLITGWWTVDTHWDPLFRPKKYWFLCHGIYLRWNFGHATYWGLIITKFISDKNECIWNRGFSRKVVMLGVCFQRWENWCFYVKRKRIIMFSVHFSDFLWCKSNTGSPTQTNFRDDPATNMREMRPLYCKNVKV